jgi:hypothetical protein
MGCWVIGKNDSAWMHVFKKVFWEPFSQFPPFYPSNLLWLRLQAAPGNREFVRDIRLMPGLIREEEAEE